ncbi:MAG TPA: hemerythrin domain-containing protein [Agriterribacter sp.]|nr:hemerythrin domain-containing protein [Agriterribacter sp.]
MNRELYQFFTKDHRRIDGLLDLATENPGEIQMEYYQRFRTGLLTHIKMEEKILFPAAQKANGGVPVPIAAKLRLEHGALTALMVPPPTPSLIKVLQHVLERHDIAEEEPGGMYDICAALTRDQTRELLEQLAQISEVPVHPHHPAAFALEAAKRALVRAGYNYDAIAQQVDL